MPSSHPLVVAALLSIACSVPDTTEPLDDMGDSEGEAEVEPDGPEGADGWDPVDGEESGSAEDDGGDAEPSAPRCGDGVLDPGELCDDGNDDDFDGCRADCSRVEPLDLPEGQWRYFPIVGTECLDGSPAGFAVNHVPDSTNLVVVLGDGGVCFPDDCDVDETQVAYEPPTDPILERNEDNPVGDWTMVHVPYCSGDLHAGNNDFEIDGKLRHFRGHDNLRRFLEHWVPSFDGVERVLLTGAGAGGFGAILNADQVAHAFGNDVELMVVDDSGPPMSAAVLPPCLQASFREAWGLDDTILAACPGCAPDDFAVDVFEHLLDEHDNLRFGLMSSTADLVIRTTFGFGWSNLQYDNCDGLATPVPLGAFHDDLFGIRTAHQDRVSTFFRSGHGHTVLQSDLLESVDDVTAAQWIGQVVDGAAVHVGP